MSEPVLLPCPFCGGRAILDNPPNSSCWRIRCGDSERCLMSPWKFAEKASTLVRAWNRRAGDGPKPRPRPRRKVEAARVLGPA